MKRLWFILFVLPLFAQNETLAIIDFESNGVSESESKNIVSKIESEVANLGFFTLVERNRIEEILMEQGFQQSGCTTSECAVEIGQLLGTDKLLLGSVGKIGNIYTINATIVSVESGKVLKGFEVISEGGIEELYRTKAKELAYKISERRTSNRSTYQTPGEKIREKEEKERMVKAKRRFDLLVGGSGLIIGGIITISGLTEPKEKIPFINTFTGQTGEEEKGIKDSAKNKITSGILLMIGSSYYLWNAQLE